MLLSKTVRGVPSSARARRRLARLGVAAVLGGVIAGILVIVPEPTHNPAATGKQGSARILPPISKHVRPAARRAIDATLDAFIPAAVARRSATTAWRLAGPELRSGSTLREWRRGISPIPYYPAGDPNYHHWSTIDAGPHYVVFNLLVHPSRGSKTSAWVFSGEMVQQGPRWLVNRLYTIATMAKPTKSGQHETGPADLAAPAPASGPPAPSKGYPGYVGKDWLGAVAAIVGAVLLVPLLLMLTLFVRGRLARRRLPPERTELPPLPTALATRDEAGERVGSGA